MILDLAAVAASFPLDVEILIVVVDAVWLTVFPLVDVSVSAVTRLVLVGVRTFVAIEMLVIIFPLGRHNGEWSGVRNARNGKELGYERT